MALPFAPTPIFPNDGQTIYRGQDNTLQADHNDPDGNTLQAGQLRLRVSGTTTWTTYNHTSLAGDIASFLIASGTLAAGQWEGQYRTSDTEGYGPWSSSFFFTAADLPATPTITSGSAVNTNPWPITWTAAQQQAYQTRTLTDSAGTPDTVIQTSAIVESAAARTAEVPHNTSPATEHQQVRVRDQGLWSDWGSLLVTVDYTYPAIPTLTLAPDNTDGSILVTIDNPAGGAAVVSNSLQRQQGRLVDGVVIWTDENGVEGEWNTAASGIAVDGSHRDYCRIAHRMQYRYRAVAFTATAQTRTTSRTYQELEAAYPTYQELEAAFPTYYEMSQLWVE